MHRRRSILVFAALALAASAASAGIDVETGRSLKARSTLVPAGEVETYRIDATAGTHLTFALTAARKTNLQFTPSLTDPNGQPVTLGPDVLTSSAHGVKVRNKPLDVTGTYRLDVSATGTGEYGLTLSSTPQPRFGPTPLTLGAGLTQPFAFSAPPGSTLTLKAKAAAKNQAVPRFGLLTGTGYSVPLAALGHPSASSHTVKVSNVGGDGDLSVEVTNTGLAGDVVVSLTVSPPRAKKTSLDLRGTRLGRPTGGETFQIQLIGPDGGTVDVTDPSSDLLGASVSVPVGALSASLPISVASTTAPTPPSGDDQVAGPAVDLRPSGTVFSTAATVTLPFNFSLLPAGATPADIRVLIREANGTSHVVIPSSVDLVHGTITMQTSGFSVCVPIVRAGLPRLGLAPGGDEYWTFSLTYSMDQDFVADDSRSRSFQLDFGEASFFGNGTFQASSETRYVQVSNFDDGNGGVNGSAQPGVSNNNDSGTWVYGADGRSIELTGGGNDAPILDVSRDGSVAIGRSRAAASTRADLILALRKNRTPLAAEADISGTYAFAAVDLHAQTSGPGQPAQTEPDHVAGTIAFDGAGGFRLSGTQRESSFDGGAGTWTNRVKSLSIASTYKVEAGGTVLLTIPPDHAGDTGSEFRLFPGTAAATFLGTDSVARGGDLFAIFLVRQGSGLSVRTLDGLHLGAGFEVNTDMYSVVTSGPPILIPDLDFRDEDIDMPFDGTGSATFVSREHKVQRDPGITGGVRVDNDPGPGSFAVGVAVDGRGTIKVTPKSGEDGVVGAVSADGMFGFYMSDPHVKAGNHMLGFFVKTAPPPLN